MKLSTRSRYGLRALLDIAVQEEDRPVMLRGIGDRQGISAKYLEHLLADLRRAGIVTSHRGAGGGFELSRDPKAISILEVVRALESGFGTTECVEHPETCPRSDSCAAREIWGRVSTAMWESLESVSLADLIEMDRQRSGGGMDGIAGCPPPVRSKAAREKKA